MGKKFKKKRPIKYFQLDRIVSMKRYLFKLMEDLRVLEVRIKVEKANERTLMKQKNAGRLLDTDYSKLFQTQSSIQSIQTEIRSIKSELRSIGILKKRNSRKLYFPCIVDHCEAFFIWDEGEPEPKFWKFRGEQSTRSIPSCWFDVNSGSIQLLQNDFWNAS